MIVKEIIFFALVFVLFVVIVFIAERLKNKGPSVWAIHIISAVIYTLVLVFIWVMPVWCNNGGVRMCNGSKDGFHMLHITQAKKCCNRYLADPKECDKFYNTEKGRFELAQVCCKGCSGFVGRPLHWSYDPESKSTKENPDWRDVRCKPPFYDTPVVL